VLWDTLYIKFCFLTLQELRDTYKEEQTQIQAEFASNYEDKLRALQEKFNIERANNAGQLQEVREMKTRVTALTSRNIELESANTSLQRRMADLVAEMEDKLAEMRSNMARKDAEVKKNPKKIK
jgi:uncharacterized small protein (DUF1192 family)